MFDDLWNFIVKRRPQVVQNREELEHVFNLIQGCESYLEIGTAEGDSLYVLSHALKLGAKITSVDLGENHTRRLVNEVVSLVPNVALYTGDSTDPNTYPKKAPHEVVFIDGGHDYDTVKSDIAMYATLATKYVIFHDIKLAGVKQAVDEYVKDKKYHEFVRSETMGYGIVTL